MLELQQILNDIAQKGSDSPFDGPVGIRFRKPHRLQPKVTVPTKPSKDIQLSLF